MKIVNEVASRKAGIVCDDSQVSGREPNVAICTKGKGMNLVEQFGAPLLGGTLIGVSASLLLLLKGRVFGVSGILAGVLSPKKGDTAWRVAALVGLFASGIIINSTAPNLLVGVSHGSMLRYVLAGLLVGFGTQLGSGCTSGHGVCGMSRMSPRSLVATLTFMFVGMMMVAIIRSVGGAL